MKPPTADEIQWDFDEAAKFVNHGQSHPRNSRSNRAKTKANTNTKAITSPTPTASARSEVLDARGYMSNRLTSKRVEAEGGDYIGRITEMRERSMRVASEGYKERDHLEVVFEDGLQYPVNKTFADTLGAACGTNAKNWVGALVQVRMTQREMPTRDGGRQMVWCKDDITVLEKPNGDDDAEF